MSLEPELCSGGYEGHYMERLVPLPQTEEEKAAELWPLFTANGNRIVLESGEKEMYQNYVSSGNTKPLEECETTWNKILFGFKSPIDGRLPTFKHEPLPNASSIRLLRILPAADNGMIRLSMEVHGLDGDAPKYDCLSYTWGNPHARMSVANFYEQHKSQYSHSATWPVQCNGKLVRVQRNLFDALREMPNTYHFADGGASERDFGANVSAEDRAESLAQLEDIQRTMTERTLSDTAPQESVLMLAASKGYTRVCHRLIQFGHDPYDRNPDGLNAIDFASRNGHVALSESMKHKPKSSRAGERLIWVDALCINQEDLSERSSQVSMMDRIYAEAGHTVVWLGVADPATLSGLRALAKLTPSLMKGTLLRSSVIPFAPYDQTKAFQDAGIPTLDNTDWAGLASIFLRQYFRRVWCLQEIVLAKSVVCFLGKNEIPWEMLLFLAHELQRLDLYNGKSFSTRFRPDYGIAVESEAEFLWECQMRRRLDHTSEDQRQEWFQSSNNKFNRGEGKPCQQSLLELLQRTATRECFDPRDRIYGLLGIAGGRPDSPNIVPDYAKPLAQLWSEVTRYWIEDTAIDSNALAVLSYMRDTSATKLTDLPSWVPDYGYIGCAPLTTVVFNANGGTEHLPSTSDRWNQLTVRGIKVGTVDSVGRARDKSRKLTMFNLDPSWFDLALKMGSVHRTGQSRTEVLWRTLCADQQTVTPQHFGRGKSPAPAEYGKQFTDMVCAMIVAARDKNDLASGRTSTTNSLHIALMTSMAEIAIAKTDQKPDITPNRLVDFMLTASASADETVGGAIDFLHKLSGDEHCFTPTIDDIAAYMRNPTYRLNPQPDQPDNDISFKALDRKEGGFVERFQAIYGGRRLYVTDRGDLGLGPASVEPGDEVWVLAGAKAPFLLRPNYGSEGQVYRLVGETYVHGFMRGEALTDLGQQYTSVILE